MREKFVVGVQAGQTLRVMLDNQPVGQAIPVPQDVSSVTVVLRDSAAATAARQGRQGNRRAGRAGGRQRPNAKE